MGHPGDLAQLRFIEMRVGENDADRGIAGEFAQNAYFLNPRNRVPWKVSIPFSPSRSMSKSSLLTFSFTAPLFWVWKTTKYRTRMVRQLPKWTFRSLCVKVEKSCLFV